MNFRKGKVHEEPEINLIPFIDWSLLSIQLPSVNTLQAFFNNSFFHPSLISTL